MNFICLECGEKIIGCFDKKFCSDVCCNVYNNVLNRDIKNIIRIINNCFWKNYCIFEVLNI